MKSKKASSSPCAPSQSCGILVCASGTGGHLLPALEIARALKRMEPQTNIEFIGSGRPLEATIIDTAGFKRHQISTVGLKRRGVLGALRFMVTLPKAICQVVRIFKECKPKLIIGVGGYVTFIPVSLARLKGIPTWIHEAELKPGMANWVLSHYATKVSLAFSQAKMPAAANTVVTGQPLRDELRAVAMEQRQVLCPSRLLVMGGSQGARALDGVVAELADFIKEQGLEVWHQCRAESVDLLKAAYAAHQVTARVEQFISNMAEAYRFADVVVSRAGAGTVMELGALNIPAVLVPYPFAQGNHQQANAEILAQAGKALIVEEGERFAERLKQALSQILEPSQYAHMRERAGPARPFEAAERIAKGCLKLVRHSLASSTGCSRGGI
ncbi:MAG: UDP-N-acetylglucosamine--N-acetylmuramyl-(pentapeptide) pyrophosphoryl-undecaprenol N-acetylglucosamine transferase [Deltaproteobacteria bacterium]|nr:UDP-N-acetylglucosamine--N-acetylmuramyl-(pentapeptide) pyrophosphoryl-undecaprenol N-acetylglucosamine transferase [Deltaproteobacteria bacterium]